MRALALVALVCLAACRDPGAPLPSLFALYGGWRGVPGSGGEVTLSFAPLSDARSFDGVAGWFDLTRPDGRKISGTFEEVENVRDLSNIQLRVGGLYQHSSPNATCNEPNAIGINPLIPGCPTFQPMTFTGALRQDGTLAGTVPALNCQADDGFYPRLACEPIGSVGAVTFRKVE